MPIEGYKIGIYTYIRYKANVFLLRQHFQAEKNFKNDVVGKLGGN